MTMMVVMVMMLLCTKMYDYITDIAGILYINNNDDEHTQKKGNTHQR